MNWTIYLGLILSIFAFVPSKCEMRGNEILDENEDYYGDIWAVALKKDCNPEIVAKSLGFVSEGEVMDGIFEFRELNPLSSGISMVKNEKMAKMLQNHPSVKMAEQQALQWREVKTFAKPTDPL